MGGGEETDKRTDKIAAELRGQDFIGCDWTDG